MYMQEHVIELMTIVAKSMTFGMKMDEYFLVQIILNYISKLEHYKG